MGTSQGDLMLGVNSQGFELYDVNCYMILHVITTVVVTCHIDGSALRATQINAEGNLVEASKVRL